MDYLIGWKEFKTDFNGRDVTMELLPLTLEAAIALTPIAGSLISASQETDGNGLHFQTKMLAMQRDAAPVLAKHVRGIKGFTVNGENPAMKLLCETPIFCPIIAKIVSELIVSSTLQQTEVKN